MRKRQCTGLRARPLPRMQMRLNRLRMAVLYEFNFPCMKPPGAFCFRSLSSACALLLTCASEGCRRSPGKDLASAKPIVFSQKKVEDQHIDVTVRSDDRLVVGGQEYEFNGFLSKMRSVIEVRTPTKVFVCLRPADNVRFSFVGRLVEGLGALAHHSNVHRP